MDSEKNSMPFSIKSWLFSALVSIKGVVTIYDSAMMWQKYGSLSCDILQNFDEQVLSKTNYKSEYKLINKNELLECKLTDKEKLCIIVLDPKKVRMTEILDPKLMSQALHYLEGGEIFDTLGFAIDQGRVIIEMNMLGSALAGMRRHDGI